MIITFIGNLVRVVTCSSDHDHWTGACYVEVVAVVC